MPYLIKKINNKYKLILKDSNKVLGIHDTKEKAQKQISAIEISKLKRTKKK